MYLSGSSHEQSLLWRTLCLFVFLNTKGVSLHSLFTAALIDRESVFFLGEFEKTISHAIEFKWLPFLEHSKKYPFPLFLSVSAFLPNPKLHPLIDQNNMERKCFFSLCNVLQFSLIWLRKKISSNERKSTMLCLRKPMCCISLITR